MSTPRITAIGEILWDVYPDRKRLGGAPFNFIYHIWKLSGAGNFISSIGSDEYGKEILDFLNSKGFPTEYISVDIEHPTGTVQVKIKEDKTPSFKISSECCYDYLRADEKTIDLVENKTDLLYFGTLAQRSEISRNTMKSLKDKNIKYFCDVNLRHDFFSKEMIEEALHVCDVIKLNAEELDKLIKILILSPDRKIAVNQLMNKYNIKLIAVTLGEEGAYLHLGNEENHYKSKSTSVIDTVGAGDAFAAVLCLGYLGSMELEKINKLANEFAAGICQTEGAIPLDDSLYNKFKREFENDS
ncbi:MAG: carbohydrate kinase [bacterium]